MGRYKELFHPYLIGITVWMGVFGVFDDYIKGKRGDGFNVLSKIVIQIVPAVFIGVMFVLFPFKIGLFLG